jgi:hypothetical protein
MPIRKVIVVVRSPNFFLESGEDISTTLIVRVGTHQVIKVLQWSICQDSVGVG